MSNHTFSIRIEFPARKIISQIREARTEIRDDVVSVAMRNGYNHDFGGQYQPFRPVTIVTFADGDVAEYSDDDGIQVIAEGWDNSYTMKIVKRSA